MAEAKNELEGGADALDDRGTDAAAGLALLRRLRDKGFESDDGKLAVALGRPVEEVRAWMRGADSQSAVPDIPRSWGRRGGIRP